MNYINILQNPYVMTVIVLWELVWKGLSLWKAAKNSHRISFVLLLIVNSVGILPIIYLLLNKYFPKILK